MKKVYDIENLDCAHCASKMEDAINKIDKVKSAKINFFTLKLTIEAEEEDFEEILYQVSKICKSIERGFKIKK